MCIFDMVVYVGMCPNSCMMDNVLWLVRVTACVSAVLLYIIIVAGCITLGQTNKSFAGCISPKVLEHDEEQ